MNRRRFIKGIAAVLALLPFVRPKATVQSDTLKEFVDQPPLGFVPPSISCWEKKGKKDK